MNDKDVKKIAIISTTYPPLGGGGVATAHYNLCCKLKDKGYIVKVFTFYDDSFADSGHEPTLEDEVLRFGLTAKERKRYNRKLIIRRKIDKWILRKEDDNLLKFQYNLVLKALIAAKKINPFLQHFHPDIVFLPSNGASGYVIDKIEDARYFHICHHNPMQMIGNPLMTEHSLKDAQKAIDIEQKSLSKIDVVICVSNYIKQLFLYTYSFNKRIEVLPNIIDNLYIASVQRQNLHHLMNLDANTPIVYIPSAGIKSKGEQFVIEIIRRLDHLFQHKIGFYLSGNLSKNQEYELSFLRNLNIYVSGDVPNEHNLSYIKDCSLCISPSHTENYSMALMEALFCGLPCVVFNVGGNGDIVIDDQTGYIVPYCDMEAMIERSSEILSSGLLQNQLQQTIRQFTEEHAAARIIEQYIALF